MSGEKTWKKTLMKQALGVVTDPRVLKVMQDPRVMQAVMGLMSVPGKVQHFTQDNVEKLAKAMALATEDEVKDLRRTVRRLEEEMNRMQRDNEKRKP